VLIPADQEANFTYLSGCSVPEASVLVAIGYPSHHDHVSHHHLFIPPAVPEVTMWSVAPPSTDEAKATFDSDNIVPTTSLPEVLHASVTCTPELVLHTLPLTQEYASLPTSVLDLIQKKSAQKDGQTHAVSHRTDLLLRALHIARLTKDEHEIALIRKANQISSGAHEVLMRELGRHASRRKDSKGKGTKERTGTEAVGEWEVEGEGDAEALFVATCKRMG
jgi:Xaa-Pro dipeptidase